MQKTILVDIFLQFGQVYIHAVSTPGIIAIYVNSHLRS